MLYSLCTGFKGTKVLIIDGACPGPSVKTILTEEERTEFIGSGALIGRRLEDIWRRCKDRISHRDSLKSKFRAAREARRLGPPVDVDLLLRQSDVPFYESAHRTIQQSAMNTGMANLGLRKILDGALQRGQSFTEGSSAEAVFRSAASQALSRTLQT